MVSGSIEHISEKSIESDPFDLLLIYAGLDGYGEKFLEIIASSGAWAQVYGGSESQILKVYAPEFNLAMYLRYGD
jgi:hypothetical protein